MNRTEAALTHGQRRFLFILGLPAFGLALASTVVSTYLPVLINELSGPAVTGVFLGTEGAFALIVPVLIGGWSDRLRTRLGGRLPFVLAGTALAVTALILMPFMAGSLLLLAIALSGFFVGYFVYYTPYYAVFPDLVPDEIRGRSLGFQGGLRSAGLLGGITGGGVLLAFWQPLPFVVAAAAIGLVTVALCSGARNRLGRGEGTKSSEGGFHAAWHLVVGDVSIRNWVASTALWEAAIAALKTFVVLYFTEGLGLSLFGAAGALALVGVAAVFAAPVSGKLADRYGPRPVMHVAAWCFGVGLIPPVFTTDLLFVAAILPVAFAAVALITLPYSMLMGMLPARSEHGVGAGLFAFTRGIGVIVGPLLAGVAVEVLRHFDVLVFDETRGYSAAFAVSSALVLVSIVFLLRVSGKRTAVA